MYILIVFIPLLSAILGGLFGRYLGEKGVGLLTTSLIGITSLMSWISLYEVGIKGENVYVHLWTWFETGLFKLDLGLMYDSVTVMMLVLVTTVSCLVHLYSTEYMNGDPHLARFMSYLSLFTFAMIILVTADNFLQMFIGWEGVGICSYLLINFWFTKIEANKAAMQAMIMNRIGDVGLCLAMFVIFYLFRSLDYNVVFSLAKEFQEASICFMGFELDRLTLIGTLLLIGATGKSAQLGLHPWLPQAMAGPTPVSALIHAATMVTQ